jgi:hypothetical protein
VTDDKKRTFAKIERKLSGDNNVKYGRHENNYLKGRGKHGNY